MRGRRGGQNGPGATTPSQAQQIEGGLQQLSAPAGQNPTSPTPDTFRGSLVAGKATDGVLDLSMDDAIARGLRQNLGLILQTTNQQSAKGQQLEQLQALLPTITGDASIEVEQVDLAAFGLKFPGLNPIIGPFQVIDFRAYLTQNLVNLPALENYHRRQAQLRRSQAIRTRRARRGGADGGQRLPAVHRGCGADRCGERGVGHGEGFAGPGDRIARRRHQPAAGRFAGAGGLPERAAGPDLGDQPTGEG